MSWIRKVFRKQIRILKFKDYMAYSNLTYSQTLEGIRRSYYDLEDERNEKLLKEYLEVTIIIFKRQLTYLFMGLMYDKPIAHNGCLFFLFPTQYMNKDGDLVVIEEKKSKLKINLKEDGIIVTPESPRKLSKAWRRGKIYPFKYDKSNHFSIHYSPFGLTHLHNGRHSGTEGIIRNEGYVLCDECDLSDMMNNVFTDGKYWYNNYDNSIISPVIDYRIAIIFELTKDYLSLVKTE